MNGHVVVEDASVRIEQLVVTNPDVVQWFKQIEESQREPMAVRALELGVFCLQRAQLGSSVDYVRGEIDKLIAAVEKAISTVPEELKEKLSGDSGPLMDVKGTLEEVRDLFTNNLDPDKQTTTLGNALIRLRDLLDPSRDDSVQKRVDSAVNSIAQVDGKLAEAVKKAVTDGTEGLRQAVDGLRNAVVGKKAEEEVVSRTPEKGFEFEEELKPILQRWASVAGADSPDHVGPQNLPGDFVITLKDTGLATIPMRIVIEARDRETGWGRARIIEQMTSALKQWDGNCGVYVSKDQSGLAREIGEWSELSCEGGPIVACVAEHLVTALRFLIVDAKLREAAKVRKDFDSSTVTGQLARFRTALNHLKNIKTKVTGVRNLLPEIEQAADSMRDEINDALAQIESALPK
jgi:hypothetical protein